MSCDWNIVDQQGVVMEGKCTADMMDFRRQNDDLVREILKVRWFLA